MDLIRKGVIRKGAIKGSSEGVLGCFNRMCVNKVC